VTEAETAQLSLDRLSQIGLSQKTRDFDSQIDPYPKAENTRVAICLVGAAKGFGVTGPSIMARLLTASLAHTFSFTHLSTKLPLSFMLCAWAPGECDDCGGAGVSELVGGRDAVPDGVILDPTSPQGTQVKRSNSLDESYYSSGLFIYLVMRLPSSLFHSSRLLGPIQEPPLLYPNLWAEKFPLGPMPPKRVGNLERQS